MNDDPLKQLWKDQSMTSPPLSLADLHAGAKRLHRRIVVRNALEYTACVAVLACFAFYLWRFPFPLMRTGSALIMIATVVVAWQLHRRGASQRLPGDAVARSWLDYKRAQLVRQRDALRSVWLWYVAPFVPGVVVFRWAVATELDASGPFVQGWGANAVVAGVFLVVIALNACSARVLQRRIEELDRQAR